MKNTNPNSGLAEVVLATAPHVEHYGKKTLAKIY
jgi:hypothetical protein